MIKQVGKHRLLFLMATDAEYGDSLKALFKPAIIGVGPVEAAINTTKALIDHSQVDLAISLGSAGSKRLQQAAIYQVSSVCYRDMDASPFGFEKGVTPFLGLDAVQNMPAPLDDIPRASIGTGANVVAGSAYDEIQADMVDMETWAVLRACQQARVPLIGLRGISDGAEPVAGYQDWTRLLHVLDEHLAIAVKSLEERLSNCELSISDCAVSQVVI